MRRALSILFLTIAGGTSAVAQESPPGPGSGTWGVEGFGGLGLLRFRSPSSAWVMSAQLAYTWIEDVGSPSVLSSDRTILVARLGRRRYMREGDQTRPYRTAFVQVTYSDFLSASTRFGGGMEWGVTHFFLPNLSAGLSTAVDVLVGRAESISLGSPARKQTTVDVTFTGIRLTAAVYLPRRQGSSD